MGIERIRYLEKYLNNKKTDYIESGFFSNHANFNILASHIGYLAEMILELAEMIEGQKQDLDNAIEQANQQTKALQESKL